MEITNWLIYRLRMGILIEGRPENSSVEFNKYRKSIVKIEQKGKITRAEINRYMKKWSKSKDGIIIIWFNLK